MGELKIADVEVAWTQLPLPIGRGLSGGPITSSTDLVCRVTTSDGSEGIGEARGAPLPLMAEVVDQGLRPLLLGQVPHFHVQIAAAYPPTAWIEVFDNAKQHVAWLDLFPGYPEVRDGMIECHDTPGWGFELNEAFLRSKGTLVHWRT